MKNKEIKRDDNNQTTNLLKGYIDALETARLLSMITTDDIALSEDELTEMKRHQDDLIKLLEQQMTV